MTQSELKLDTKSERPLGRTLVGILMVGVGIWLIYALFDMFGVTGADFMQALRRTPWQLYVVGIAIVVFNNIVGVFKWRAAIRWLDPAAAMPPVIASFEASILGALLGLLLLSPVTSAAARWVVLKRNGGRGGLAVSTTFYEQVCDVFMLTTAGIAGLVILLFALSPMIGGPLLVAAFAMALAAMGPIFAASALLFTSLGRLIPPGHIAGGLSTLAEILHRLAAAPWRTSLTMMSYSALRLILQTTHGVAVALVFAPTAAPFLVAAGVPPALLVATVPITPGGLGVADWTWSGILILGGAAPTFAVITSLASRVLYIFSLGAVGVAVALLRLPRGLVTTS